jgi:WD40 repeat protein
MLFYYPYYHTRTLTGHHNNVSAVLFHPRLPIILSGGEDGTVRLWHSSTYRAETTLNYGMERVWSLAASTDSNKVQLHLQKQCYSTAVLIDDCCNRRSKALLWLHDW